MPGDKLIRDLILVVTDDLRLRSDRQNMSGKWLEVLKEIAPETTRAAVLRDPMIAGGIGQFAVIQSVAPSLGIDVRAINLRDQPEIERGLAAYSQVPRGGLVVASSPWALVRRELIAHLAAQ